MVVMLPFVPAQIRLDRSITVSPFQHVRSAGSTAAGPREGLPAVVVGWSDLRHFPSFYPDFQEAVCPLCRDPHPTVPRTELGWGRREANSYER